MFLQYQNDEKLDDYLQEYCKKSNILNSYFIIDEAHNYFDNQDKVKNWWFTYHRHLNHEILLITQNKSLINSQYRNVPELFVKAQPRTKAISKNVLRYFNYTDYRMTQRFSVTEIKSDKTYFDLYTSGNVSNQKLVGLKYLILFVFVIIFTLSVFSYLIYSFFINDSISNITEVKKPELTNEINTSEIKNQEIKTFNNINEKYELFKEDENKYYFKFICFEKICYSKVNSERLSLPYDILKKYLITAEDIYIETKSKRLNVYFLANEDTFNFLKGVRKNEKDITFGNGVNDLFNANIESGRTGNQPN